MERASDWVIRLHRHDLDRSDSKDPATTRISHVITSAAVPESAEPPPLPKEPQSADFILLLASMRHSLQRAGSGVPGPRSRDKKKGAIRRRLHQRLGLGKGCLFLRSAFSSHDPLGRTCSRQDYIAISEYKTLRIDSTSWSGPV